MCATPKGAAPRDLSGDSVGDDPQRFVTNRFGQTRDVANPCDASVFLNCTDKSTTLSILAFSLRTSEPIVEQFRQGDHRPL
jgi:choline dehydrogenase-like flavoprotein